MTEGIIISGKAVKEIIVTDVNENLLAMITDDGEIVTEKGIKVKCTPYQIN